MWAISQISHVFVEHQLGFWGPSVLPASPAPQPECFFLSSGREEPGFSGGSFLSKGGLGAISPLLDPYPGCCDFVLSGDISPEGDLPRLR